MAFDPEMDKRFAELEFLTKTSPHEQVEAADNILRDSVMTAAARIVDLVNNADRETTSLAAAKYITDRYLPTRDSRPVDDPLKSFVQAIQSKATSN